MKNSGSVIALSAAAIVLFAGEATQAQTQAAQSVVHPAPASQTITVTVTQLRHEKHGPDKEILMGQAVGFANDTCDVITTFDVVKPYEERETWKNVKQQVNIVIDGRSYPAKFRHLGFYPLGLNLACVDFVSPMDRAELNIVALPLQTDPANASSLSYEDGDIVSSDPGTPFLNKNGEISSVLVAIPNGPLEFASADDIRRFLTIAASISPAPLLHRQSVSTI